MMFCFQLGTLEYYVVNDSPHPHDPLLLGLLNVNSAETSFSMKSIVVPITCNNAFESTNNLMFASGT